MQLKNKYRALIARNLLKNRERLNLTQGALAKKSGVSVSYIKKLEAADSSATLEKLAMLARAFEVSLFQFLQLKECKKCGEPTDTDLCQACYEFMTMTDDELDDMVEQIELERKNYGKQ